MTLNWHKLRPWNGSQQLAFEELCCQFAAFEMPAAGSRFFRKGTPDAGVECFWRLPNGDEWAWQAKFFLAPPNARQWAEVDGSVKAALAKHSRLTKYTVCFPLDRPDARVKGQSSFLDKWNRHTDKWRQWAAAKKMAVEFEYWGESDLTLRLSQEHHRGRHWFWFNEERLSLAWFRKQLEEAIENAGERYTRDLNVGLPISKCFDALGRTPQFHAEYGRSYENLKKSYSHVRTSAARTECSEDFRGLDETIQGLGSLVEAALLLASQTYQPPVVIEPLRWSEMADLLSRSLEVCGRIETKLRELQEERQAESTLKDPTEYGPKKDFKNDLYHLYELQGALYEFKLFCEGSLATLSNMPAMLLTGTAGQGKTHLLCDVAWRDLNAGFPRILLHGEHFSDDEPWGQIIRLLGLDCTKEAFLGALEVAAQANRCRILIFIDALNEGQGRGLWQKYLAGMLVAMARSPWLGLVVSVRKSYEDLVVPPGLVPQRLVRVEHYGFQEHEYEAMQRFFSHYGIQPTAPLLVPEFSNPQFLKLLCQGLSNQGFTQVPTGLRGITAVTRFFIDAINKRLAKPDRLDYDEHAHFVQQAVERLAAAMAEKKTLLLQRDEALQIVNSIHSGTGYERSLFRHLIVEGLLSEDRWLGPTGAMEIIRFTYERFTDHLIAKHLLDHHLNAKVPKRSFSNRSMLGKLCEDERACWMNQGLIEALSIQLPERVKRELTELAPHTVDYEPVRRAFIESVIWRDVSAFTAATRRYIDQHVIRYAGSRGDFLDAWLTVAPIPSHPFNADQLHRYLMRFTLADRDRGWLVFLHEEWGARRAVDRLVEWALEENDKSQVSDEVIRLTGVEMAWFLASSNRFLRDRATKALVRLFEKRIPCLQKVLVAFHKVNDPYITERLWRSPTDVRFARPTRVL